MPKAGIYAKTADKIRPMLVHIEEGNPTNMLLLRCLNCETKLDLNSEWCSCPGCGARWPVVGGIPRFFETPSYYWGEISRNEARALLAAARKGTWAEAVSANFPPEDNMTFGLLDLQRASWAPMLGLDKRSVALDIGSGYGAIAHSLSRSVGEVYCIEAIPERIEFTQERLRQEGIRNVRLIQASATQMPLMDNSFDLVVTNGVLEWVGEWDLEGTPRDVQLGFLNRICRLLKDDGVLVIGIENRFGYGLLLGGNDHSGIPYTSLVPRPVASFMLRHSSTPHHRTQLNPKKEYRTYTYSQRGYRKLLADAGFRELSCYWAQPGYNQPYHLIPLAKPQWLQERWLDLLDHPGPAVRRSWRRRLKRVLGRSPLLPLIVPDFVLFASKRLGRKTKVRSWVKERLNESGSAIDDCPTEPQLNWALATHPFADDSVARLENPGKGPDLYIKIKVAAHDGGASFETELANRAKIRNGLEASANLALGVPHVHATLIDGNISYLMESGCGGKQVSRIIRRLGYFEDERRVENDFASIVARVIELTEALKDVSVVRALDSEWYKIPEELKNPLHRRNGIEKVRYFLGSSAGSRAAWTQHGDLSVENVFFDQQTGRMEVIDWGDVAAGFPPLYDLFSLFSSSGYLTPTDETVRFPSEEERCIASFRAVFFGDTSFTSVVRELILHACQRLKVQPELIPALLVEFLLVRVHYYRKKSVFQHRVHLRLLQLCLDRNHPSLAGFRYWSKKDFKTMVK